MNNQKQYSVKRDYQFEKDGAVIQGTLELTIEKNGETITGATLSLSGDNVTEEAQKAADSLAQKFLEEQSVDALSGATPVEVVEVVQEAAVECLDMFEEDIFIDNGEKGTEEINSEDDLKDTEEITAASSSSPETPAAQTVSPAVFFIAGFLICAFIAAVIGFCFAKRKKNQQAQLPAVEDTHNSEWVNRDGGTSPKEKNISADVSGEPLKTIQIGQIHNIGSRPGQQDSLGVAQVPGGVLAVVADGMGGLADGDKVSQTIVRTMLGDSGQIIQGGNHQRLYALAAHANKAVLAMLGPARQYQCGSTLITVLIQDMLLQWLSIGDSHIYLYRGGRLIQLNREHTLEQELLLEAANGRRSINEIYQNPKRKGLTSFIGMGELKYVDSSSRPLRLQAGDRILLMTDGVFNTLSDVEIETILSAQATPVKAAAALEQRVLAHKNPKQDNFTAILLYL